MNSSAFTSFFHRAACVALVAGCLATAAIAQDRPNTYTEKTGEAFAKLKPLSEAKNYDGMLAVLDAAQAAAEPTSYDMALILDMKAKCYGQTERFDKAIEAWEGALRVSEGRKYFDAKATLDIKLFLAQFCYQVGVSSKVPAVQRQFMEKSSNYFKTWLAATPKPPADISMFYASILYNQAVVDSKHVDNTLLKQARDEVEKGINNSIHPKEGFYVLLLAILQQENDSAHAAETLELLVKQFPQKKDYWPSLWATYLNMANEAGVGDKKDDAKVRENYIRAIMTQERAQALGLMKTPKDNLQLVGLYLNVGQFGKATDLLYSGIKSGAIESDQKNWALLGYYYQQANEEKKAIAALEEASALFPNTGSFKLQIGQIYQGMEKTKEARDAYREAIKRGGLDKPYFAQMTLAYVCYELEDFDEALAALIVAEKDPAAAKDSQFIPLKKGVEGAIHERELQKAELAKKTKSL